MTFFEKEDHIETYLFPKTAASVSLFQSLSETINTIPVFLTISQRRTSQALEMEKKYKVV